MMHENNRLLAMVEGNTVPLGMQCFTADHTFLEVLGRTGFDFVMLDTEHCGTNPRALEDSIRAADGAGLVAIVRVPEAEDGTAIRRALEAGAQGLIVPMVKSAADLRKVLDAALFPPVGKRGMCPAVRAADYSYRTFGQYAEWSNANVLVIPLIEHPDAVESIDEICAVDEVRIITFGASDFAYAAGEGTQGISSPTVQAAYRRVRDAAQRHGVALMAGSVAGPTVTSCATALDDGVRMFCIGLDVMGFRKLCEETIRALNTAVAGSTFSRPATPESAFPDVR